MTIYDFASRAYDGARGALSALDEQIQRLEPEVEAARAASTQAEMDTSITDAAFDAVDAVYTSALKRLEALQEMRGYAAECCQQLDAVADAARVAGV